MGGNAGTTNAVFQVSLPATSAVNVTVSYATSNGTALAGSDYLATSGVVNIPSGLLSTTLVVKVNGDMLYEPNEIFYVNLSNPANSVLGKWQGLGTITNDDPPVPALSISDVTVTETASGTTDAVFTVSLSAASGLPTTFTYATADGTATAGADYEATGGVVTIPAGQLSATLVVKVLSDAEAESSEVFYVNLSGPVNATLANGQGMCTISEVNPAGTPFFTDAPALSLLMAGGVNAERRLPVDCLMGGTLSVRVVSGRFPYGVTIRRSRTALVMPCCLTAPPISTVRALIPRCWRSRRR